MFENIGSKIKSIAKVWCIIGIIASFVSSVVMCTLGNELILVGLATFLVGALLSWVSSAFLYGFGQLIDNSDKLVKKMAPEYASGEEVNQKAVNQKTASGYVHENWADTIKALDDKELYDRSASSDYTDEYRDMCVAELEKRAGNSENDIILTRSQVNEEFSAELQRYNISELELILKDQRQLYNGQELAAIEAELNKRRNMA